MNLILSKKSYLFHFSILFLYIKLGWLGLPNRTVDNSDSKPSKFEHRYQSDLKSDDEILAYQIILISFQLNLTNFWLKLVYFWLKLTYYWLKDWKSPLKDWKSQLKDWKSQLNDRKSQILLKKLIYIDFIN